MNISWNDKDPIYRQLKDRILEMILEGVFLKERVCRRLDNWQANTELTH